jgi:hypothetical protein
VRLLCSPSNPFSKDFIVNTARTISTYRPLQGPGVRVPAAMVSFRACAPALHPGLQADQARPTRRDEHRHPGEGSA